MKKIKNLSSLFLIGIGIIIGIMIVTNVGSMNCTCAKDDVQLGSQSNIVKSNSLLQQLNDAYSNISKAVTPSVVFIKVEIVRNAEKTPEMENDESQFFYKFFGPDFMNRQRPPVERGIGSGFIISKDGYILTNNHVVGNAGNKDITVVLSDKREFKAKLIGKDKHTDLAVIKIDAKDLTVSALGNSDDTKVGHIVLAIGAPLGLESTITQGIVSALGRDLRIEDDSYRIENFIQTDAAVNPGNSGGPLLNIYGEVIGINTAIASTNARYQGYSFAIPINLAKKVAEDIIKYGKFRRGFLGIQIKPVDAISSKAVGLDKPKGVWVESVIKDQAADKAGIQTGDIILSVDDQEVNSSQELQTKIASKQPGAKAKIKVWRNKSIVELSAVIGNTKDDDNDFIADNSNNSVTLNAIGITVNNIDDTIKEKYDVKNGVIITEVKMLSQAEKRGLNKNDVILEIGNEKIKSVEQFDKELKKLKPGDATILRTKNAKKEVRIVAIEIPE